MRKLRLREVSKFKSKEVGKLGKKNGALEEYLRSAE